MGTSQSGGAFNRTASPTVKHGLHGFASGCALF